MNDLGVLQIIYDRIERFWIKKKKLMCYYKKSQTVLGNPTESDAENEAATIRTEKERSHSISNKSN